MKRGYRMNGGNAVPGYGGIAKRSQRGALEKLLGVKAHVGSNPTPSAKFYSYSKRRKSVLPDVLMSISPI